MWVPLRQFGGQPPRTAIVAEVTDDIVDLNAGLLGLIRVEGAGRGPDTIQFVVGKSPAGVDGRPQ